ncbi:hypothetical protein MAR_012544 [Mya arenaria]|uniref:DUF7789 domain-containing protein n=1 Tax=Mya arenaria TaxID=6604 RepID=A0ABY7FXD4_MYAAR|nr:hypothetical protein MAR_012544 [Mya arenaria]
MAEEDNESGDYTRFGIPDTPRSTVTTVIGKTRTWAGLQWKEKLFLVFSLVNILAAIGLTTYRLVDVARTDTNNKDFTFTILIIER